MADDKNKNEDPEEERDDQFDDDEDFGLPDLEYDELDDDDDDEDLSDEEQEDALEEEEIVPKDDEIDLSGDNLDDVELTDADLEDSDEPEDWEKELEKELEDELKSDDETGGFYEEESYEEFESQGESQVASSVFDDDSNDTGFGATSEYTEETYDTPTYTTSSGVSDEDQAESRGKFVRTVVIGTLLFAVVAVVLYLYSGSDDAPEEKKVAKVEQKAPAKKPEPEVKEVPKEETPAKVEEKKPVARPKAQKPKPTPNTTPAGEITKFDQPTGKTYVIVGSFFDDDLATDYASKLASEGKSPMVIPPFNDSRFYRVAIAGFDSFKDAQQSLDGYKSEYGSDVWTLRY